MRLILCNITGVILSEPHISLVYEYLVACLNATVMDGYHIFCLFGAILQNQSHILLTRALPFMVITCIVIFQ